MRRSLRTRVSTTGPVPEINVRREPSGRIAPVLGGDSGSDGHGLTGMMTTSRLDREALARLHERYRDCGLRNRDDTGCMRRIDPSYEKKSPRW